MDEKKDNVIEFADTPEEDNENKETSEAADRSSADKSAADKSAADTSVADTSADNKSAADNETGDSAAEDDGDIYDDEEGADEDEEEAEAERLEIKEKRRKDKRKKKTHGRLIFALIMVTLVISLAVLGAVAVITVSSEILGMGRSDTEFSVEIPENSGTEAIANILQSEGIIERPVIFRIYSKLKGADGTYIAGSHKLNPNMTYGDIIEALQKDAINPREFVNITFPEGIRLIDAARKLEDAGVCGADEFIRVFNSTTFGFDFEKQVKSSSKKFYKMEGYFFPDTYQFYLEEDPKNVAKKVCKNFEYKVTPDMYGRMEDLGMTLDETITLASIVQAEASSSIDMKLVSSVFHNRLNNPDQFPLLQSDPTTNYVEEVIKPNLEIYSQSMCDAYDTYKGGGLPPGAICNPGIEAIQAVLYPRETDYYYFCSDLDTGEFFFATTLEEHEANLVKAHLVAGSDE